MMRSKILESHSNAHKNINELLGPSPSPKGRACECYQAQIILLALSGVKLFWCRAKCKIFIKKKNTF